MIISPSKHYTNMLHVMSMNNRNKVTVISCLAVTSSTGSVIAYLLPVDVCVATSDAAVVMVMNGWW